MALSFLADLDLDGTGQEEPQDVFEPSSAKSSHCAVLFFRASPARETPALAHHRTFDSNKVLGPRAVPLRSNQRPGHFFEDVISVLADTV